MTSDEKSLTFPELYAYHEKSIYKCDEDDCSLKICSNKVKKSFCDFK